jgi:drug/metabolite transporter (DMT)-like permease
MTKPTKAIFSLMFCALLWSTGGMFIKSVNWSPIVIAGIRSLIGGSIIFLYIRRPKITFSFPQIAAALCNTGTMLLFVTANKMTTAANAILLQYSAPIFVAILGWLIIREKPRWEHWVGLVCIMAGIGLFFLDKVSPGNFTGNVIAVISGVTFALYAVFMRMQKEGSAVESVLLSHALTFLISIPFIIMTPIRIAEVNWFPVIFLGVFQIGVSSLLFSYGIKHVSAIQTMLIAGLEPILNPIWVFLAMGERPSLNAVFGGLIIIFAVTFSSAVSAHRLMYMGGSKDDDKGRAHDLDGVSEPDSAKNPASLGAP